MSVFPSLAQVPAGMTQGSGCPGEEINAQTKPKGFYTLGRHKKTGTHTYSGFRFEPGVLVSAGRVLQELHERTVGVDDHDVILASKGFLVCL